MQTLQFSLNKSLKRNISVQRSSKMLIIKNKRPKCRLYTFNILGTIFVDWIMLSGFVESVTRVISSFHGNDSVGNMYRLVVIPWTKT